MEARKKEAEEITRSLRRANDALRRVEANEETAKMNTLKILKAREVEGAKREKELECENVAGLKKRWVKWFAEKEGKYRKYLLESETNKSKFGVRAKSITDEDLNSTVREIFIG